MAHGYQLIPWEWRGALKNVVAKMAQWREFANKQRAKRTKTDKLENDFNRGEIIVQKMSSEVSQKPQKY